MNLKNLFHYCAVLVFTFQIILFADYLCAQQKISVLVNLGIQDAVERDWSGNASISAGELLGIRGWQFDDTDSIVTRTSWNATTRRAFLRGSRLVTSNRYQQYIADQALFGYPYTRDVFERIFDDHFLYATVSSIKLIVDVQVLPSSILNISTNYGSFPIILGDLQFGKTIPALDLNASYERTAFASKITGDERHDDTPAIAIDANGIPWTAWISYKYQDGDRIYLGKLENGIVSEKIEVTDSPGDLFQVRLAIDKNNKIWIVWSENKNGNWELVGKTYHQGEMSRIYRLTDSEEPDIFPSLISDVDGNIWMAWQSFRNGNSDIFLKCFDGNRWSELSAVTTFPGNDWEPKLTADSKGTVYVIWDTYRYGDYDVIMAVIKNGAVTQTIPVANTKNFEGYSAVTCDNMDRIWIAWENAGEDWGKDHPGTIGYSTGAYKKEYYGRQQPGPTHGINPMEKFVEVVCYNNGKLEKPYTLPGTHLPSQYKIYNGYPYLTADKNGNIWIFYRCTWGVPIGPLGGRGYWTIFATYFNGRDWSVPFPIPNSNGGTGYQMDAAVSPDGKIYTVYCSDDRTSGSFSVLNEFEPSKDPKMYNIYSAELESVPPPTEWIMRKHEICKDNKTPVKDERASRMFTIIDGKRYNLYYGDLHRHTDISMDGRNDGSPFDLFRYALDAAQLDFILLTDHNFGSDPNGLERYVYKWWKTEKLEDVFKINGMLMPLFGYERSLPWPWGHRNVIRAKRGFLDVPRFTVQQDNRSRIVEDDEKRLWKKLAEEGGDPITIPHTPASAMGTNWTTHPSNPQYDRLVEIYQGDRNSAETILGPKESPHDIEPYPEGFIWNALARGAKFGFIASSDHESTHISYACVYAEEFSREAIFKSMKARRTFAATDKIFMDVKVNDRFMGEEFATSIKPLIRVHVIGTDIIDRVEVIKNNTFVYSLTPKDSREVSFTYIDENPQIGEGYYYVRVIQKDEAMAWGSPVWTTYNP